MAIYKYNDKEKQLQKFASLVEYDLSNKTLRVDGQDVSIAADIDSTTISTSISSFLSSNLSSILSNNYYSSDDIISILNQYYTSSEICSILSSYYNKIDYPNGLHMKVVEQLPENARDDTLYFVVGQEPPDYGNLPLNHDELLKDHLALINLCDGYPLRFESNYSATKIQMTYDGKKYFCAHSIIAKNVCYLKGDIYNGSRQLLLPNGDSQYPHPILYSIDMRGDQPVKIAGKLAAIKSKDFNINNSCIFYGYSGSIGNHYLIDVSEVVLRDNDVPFSNASAFINSLNLQYAQKSLSSKLSENCYNSLFSGCRLLCTPPELPVTELCAGCYTNMFYDCYSLTSVPELLATTLADSCYKGMFAQCSSLLSAPKLPAMTLANSCYEGMFLNAKFLNNRSIKLPAKNLCSNCYSNMFRNSNISSIEVSFTEWEEYTEGYSPTMRGWVYDLARNDNLQPFYGYYSGVFRCPSTLGNNITIRRDTDHCPETWLVVNTDVQKYLVFSSYPSTKTQIIMVKPTEGEYLDNISIDLEYSYDANTWYPFIINTTGNSYPQLSVGAFLNGEIHSQCYIRAGSSGNSRFTTSDKFTSHNTCYHFKMFSESGGDNNIIVYGNLSAIFGSKMDQNATYFPAANLFYGCSSIVNISELSIPDTSSFGDDAKMFEECTRISGYYLKEYKRY